MSVDTYVAYGFNIKLNYEYATTKRRGCGHDERDFDFCPQCGKSMWIEKVSPDKNADTNKFIEHLWSKGSNVLIHDGGCAIGFIWDPDTLVDVTPKKIPTYDELKALIEEICGEEFKHRVAEILKQPYGLFCFYN